MNELQVRAVQMVAAIATLSGCAVPTLPSTERSVAVANRAARLEEMQAKKCCDSWANMIPAARVTFDGAPVGFTVGLWPFQSVYRFASGQSYYALVALEGASEGDTLAMSGIPDSGSGGLIDVAENAIESGQFIPRALFLDERRTPINEPSEQREIMMGEPQYPMWQTHLIVPRGAVYAVIYTPPHLVGHRFFVGYGRIPIVLPTGNFVIVGSVKSSIKRYHFGTVTGHVNARLIAKK
jgi:hypothetical protein